MSTLAMEHGGYEIVARKRNHVHDNISVYHLSDGDTVLFRCKTVDEAVAWVDADVKYSNQETEEYQRKTAEKYSHAGWPAIEIRNLIRQKNLLLAKTFFCVVCGLEHGSRNRMRADTCGRCVRDKRRAQRRAQRKRRAT